MFITSRNNSGFSISEIICFDYLLLRNDIINIRIMTNSTFLS